MKQYFPHS